MSRTAHRLTALAASALTAVLAATAGAANADEPPSVTVKFADLNLHSAQGVATLYHRLTVAAQQVCPIVDRAHLQNYALAHDCQQAAISRAVDAIGNPVLARVAIDHGVSND